MDNRFRTEIHLSLVLRLENLFLRATPWLCSSFQLQDSFQDRDDFLLCSKIVLGD